ncbi:FAD-dependent oxidoreductase [Haloechinothrix sp. YIM 98757]|uniref:FAD-dependent oxidoreductase n=1 Tax=Haloechinothrix aidingensis TaxID=2752311 RepID=A0A838ACE9_9PSEU|nr:FAD-dependent oxidoreductase [Haloechinothrix aidingensis]MBA0126848.1 FAD-dependent oxidoreductase [Haloechinothrix aidingensis]
MTVAVIGAGVAGAAAARTLRSHGVDALVLEASEAVGGRTRTVGLEYGAADSGAIFLMGSYDATFRYLREAGHEHELRRWEARAAVLDGDGERHPVRFDRPWTFLRLPQLTWRDRRRAVRAIGTLAMRRGPAPFDTDELAAVDDGRTLAEWARARFGDRVYEYVVRPLMGPLTGADPETISAAFTIALLGRVHRTQLWVPPGGLGQIASWLLDGVDVRTATPVRALEYTPDGMTVHAPGGPFDVQGVIVATDVRQARELLDGVVDSSVCAALDAVEPVPAYHVLLGYHTDPWPDAGHDLVVQAGPGQHHNYGVLRNSRRAPYSVPPGGQTVSVYFDRTQAPDSDEEQVVARARAAVDRAFGFAVPDFHRVFGMDVALIAPTPGHYEAMRATRDAMPSRIRLAGDYLSHSGIEAALLSGERAARDLLAAGRATARAAVAQHRDDRRGPRS